MTPHIAVFDDFFPPDHLRSVLALIKLKGFSNVVSPHDGVTYPGICSLSEIADPITDMYRLRFMLNVSATETFARLTSAAQGPAPHQIHSDRIMGDYGAILYLSESWPKGSGTSFWSHSREGKRHEDHANHEMLQCHSNDRHMWGHYFLSEGKQNRLLLYDARLFHCAEPVGGFGSGPEDGRIVLTSFLKEVR